MKVPTDKRPPQPHTKRATKGGNGKNGKDSAGGEGGAGDSGPSGPALALQLRHAAACVQAVAQGQSLGVPLAAVPPALRPGVQALAFHALRHWGTTQALVQALASRQPEPLVQALLGTALSLLLVPHPWDSETGPTAQPDAAPLPARLAGNTGNSDNTSHMGNTRSAGEESAATGVGGGGEPLYRAHTVVDQCIQAAKQHPRSLRQAPFINACLRRFLRERAELLQAAQQSPQGRWNHPAWWVETLRRDHPGHWRGLLHMAQQAGPMTLRVNARHHSAAAYQALLAAAGLGARPIGADGLLLAQAVPVTQLPGFAEGWVSVQDAAAQRAAPLLLSALAPQTGERPRVLDACAAPGGKSAHLLERADLDLWALDVDAQRCQRTTDTLQRLGLQARVRCADAADTSAWWDGRPFDAILLDAPCSGSGIVRRHPDARWLRRASDIDALVRTQQRLLEALWPLLKPGGRLVYATCSVFIAEGSAQVARFLAAHADARALPGLGYLLPAADAGGAEALGDNAAGEYDGFFYAALDKAA